MHPDPPPVLRISAVTKRFGALVANDAISLDLHAGEILALLGENGAGKSTLMNILFGHYVADEGTVEVATVGGPLQALPPGRPGAALAAGVGMVHQHFALAESLTVLETVVLGTRPAWSPVLRIGEARARLDRLMAESGLSIDPDRRVGHLTVGEKQRVEILKVLYRGARILVLDEPTAVLTPGEVEGLFAVLRRLVAGGLAIVFISHKLGEVTAIADRVAVLRGGRKVADRAIGTASRAELAALMVGRDVAPSRRTARMPGAPLLVLSAVTAPGPRGRPGLDSVSLTVREGEIVGIAGVSGNGQGALAALLAGTGPRPRGTATLAGAPLGATPRAVMRAGIGRIPEDRHHEGVVGQLSIAENLAIEELESASVRRFGFLRRGAIRARAQAAIEAYDVRCPGPDTPIRLLSGGNMQKVILARVLDRSPRLILANQPTRGLDIGAATAVHRRLLDARERGAGIVLISEDLDELLGLSDRVGVMVRGRLTPPEPVEGLTLEHLGLLMGGSGGERAA